MRLSTQQIQVIKQTTREIFGSQAKVSLFGSRLNDQLRGGDIDLLVTLPTPCHSATEKALRLTARLQLRLGDQPFDVLVVDPQSQRNPVHEHAIASGQSL